MFPADPHATAAPAPDAGPTDSPSGPSTVLLVDDDQMLLDGLRRSLRPHRGRWQAVTTTSGEEALRILTEQHVDVIVSDMRMQTMNGAELLTLARERHPGTARIILTGYTDANTIISAVGPAQQFLIKPCHSDELVAALDRVTSLHDLVTDSHLRELLGGVGILPAPPHIYQEITRITADPEYSLDEVVDTIATDLAVTTEVLRLANSSFFGLTGQVSTLGQAVSLLGLSTIQALAVSGAAFSSSAPPPGLNPSTLTMDGLGIGGLARRIAQAEGWYPASIGNVFLTGLLHQIGLPLLAGAHPEGWTEIRSRAAHTPEVLTDPWLQADAEQEFFGTTSTRVSAYLLGLWGFPDDVLRAVADQPAAPDDPGPTPAGHLLTYARLRHHGRPEAGTGPYLDQARLTRWEAVGADR